MDLEDNDAWRSEYTYSAGNYKAIENYYQYIKNLTINIPIGHTYSEQAMKLLCCYAGTVSKERPYRREVANAVLDYLQSVIENRR